MSTSIAHPGTARNPGSSTAKASTAAAVIVLAAVVAGSALAAGIATGTATEAPEAPAVTLTTTAPETTPPITSYTGQIGGLAFPLKAD
ncbi:MAG TPA: hypothetical protein VEB69_03435 [Acidimicrobiia bacterium]|nr:hypothetical protein [Acidimicrobiia bacterium]